MERKRLLTVGLEENEVRRIKESTDHLVIAYDTLPNVQLREGILYAESPTVRDRYLKVDAVLYHGIFEHDFDFITLLALWGGPCLPGARGMMDLRLRHSGLVRALEVTRFGDVPRGMTLKRHRIAVAGEKVAKWGNWHCGEDKAKFSGEWDTPDEIAVIEPFFEGEAVRIMLVGEQAWQLRLTGEDWLKSIHHADSAEMEMDPELMEDTRNIAARFGLAVVGVDYIVGNDGRKYLLEVNHIPNVTIFDFVNEAYLAYAAEWLKGLV